MEWVPNVCLLDEMVTCWEKLQDVRTGICGFEEMFKLIRTDTELHIYTPGIGDPKEI